MNPKYIDSNRFFNFLVSPFILALPIVIGIILILPEGFKKYEIKIVETGYVHKENSIEEYHDLDRDGFSERIVSFKNSLGFPAIKVLNNDGSTIDQWNFKGRFPEKKDHFYCGDMDNDGKKEIYAFTIKSDSLLLHAISPFTVNTIPFSNKLVSEIWKINDTVQLFVNYGTFKDLDGDGNNELIFAVKARFSLQPRGIYVYSLIKDSIYHTKPMGANIIDLIVEDINKDGKPEILCSSITLGNISDSLNIPFNDYSSWIMGFDKDLNFLFPPLEYNVYPSSAFMTILTIESKKLLAIYFKNRSKNDVSSRIALIDTKGKIIKQKSIMGKEPRIKDSNQLISLLHQNNSESLFLIGGSNALQFDNDLNTRKFINVDRLNRLLMTVDLNNDGLDELIFGGDNNRLIITQPGFKDPVIIQNDKNLFSEIPYSISIKKNGSKNPELFITSDNKTYQYTFIQNRFYFLKYPIWIGIYILILSIILLIRTIQRIQLQRKMEIENRLNALQLKTIKSQMDPHFMFNVLNSISTNILSEKKEIAYAYMIKFSSLLRSLFTNADNLVISLQKELEFVDNYLELEQIRFKDNLHYHIEVDSNVDQSVQIPRMLIQLFVENSIKHGLQNKDGTGKIIIQIGVRKAQTVITIQDNGIGRDASKKFKEGNGKGLVIIKDMIQLFEKLKGIIITFHYDDLSEIDGQIAGTKVDIMIPGKS